MANYTVEEGSPLVSNVEDVSVKKQMNYLKMACVGLLVVVAYMAGSRSGFVPAYEDGSLSQQFDKPDFDYGWPDKSRLSPTKDWKQPLP